MDSFIALKWLKETKFYKAGSCAYIAGFTLITSRQVWSSMIFAMFTFNVVGENASFFALCSNNNKNLREEEMRRFLVRKSCRCCHFICSFDYPSFHYLTLVHNRKILLNSCCQKEALEVAKANLCHLLPFKHQWRPFPMGCGLPLRIWIPKRPR